MNKIELPVDHAESTYSYFTTIQGAVLYYYVTKFTENTMLFLLIINQLPEDCITEVYWFIILLFGSN